MELTMKQKAVVLGVMIAIFLGSAAVKEFIVEEKVREESIITERSAVTENENEESGQLVNVEEYQNQDDSVYRMVIDVEGAVVYPGIVKLAEGSRVYQAIDEAGGLLETADTRYVNLAEILTDGSIIYIPEKNENQSGNGTSDGSGGSTALAADSGKININTAGKEELMKLPGIGESYAQAIIDYRNTTGSFKKKEDIKNVSGIGDAKFQKMEELICVY